MGKAGVSASSSRTSSCPAGSCGIVNEERWGLAHGASLLCAHCLQLVPRGMGKANIVTGPDHVIWCGDLNYRLDWGQQAETLAETPVPEDHAAIVERVASQSYGELLATDQLARELAARRVFVGFAEAPIGFPPTFKVAKGTQGLLYGLKRSPAWCDRVLFRSNLPHKPAVPGDYYCCPDIATSDHKPVAAVLQLPLGEWSGSKLATQWHGKRAARWQAGTNAIITTGARLLRSPALAYSPAQPRCLHCHVSAASPSACTSTMWC